MTIRELGRACCGCEACVNACPIDCIQMEEDEEGFRYPRVNDDICKVCGRCVSVCPVINPNGFPPSQERAEAYAAWARDENVRLSSSSGGVFSVLADTVLNVGGVVVGAAWTENFLAVKHIIVEGKNEIGKLRGSKYLQSHIGFLYRGLRQLLEEGRDVLFVGTPCQVAGLRSYLGAENENLVTCDLVCHGVPSAKVFRHFLKFLEEQHNASVANVSFRDKHKGWKRYSVNVRFLDGSEYIRSFDCDPYMYGFLRNLYLRPSCYECLFIRIPRLGDITLGDFWGVGSIDVNLDDDKGVSLVLVNTSKGKEILSRCSSNIQLRSCSFEAAVNGNPCLVKPVTVSPHREEFFVALRNHPFSVVMSRYMRPRNKVRWILARCLTRVTAVMNRWLDRYSQLTFDRKTGF